MNSKSLYTPKSIMTHAHSVLTVIKGCKSQCTWNGKNYCNLADGGPCLKINGDHRTPIFRKDLLPNIVLNSAKEGDCIFLNQAGEMFGSWVPDEQIYAVIAMMASNPRCHYWIQTTFPKRMFSFDYPENVILATKIEKWDKITQKRAEDLKKCISKFKGNNYTAITVGPFLEPLEKWVYSLTDQIVIASTRTKFLPKPKKEWILDIVKETRKSKTNLFMEPIISQYIPKKYFIQELCYE